MNKNAADSLYDLVKWYVNFTRNQNSHRYLTSEETDDCIDKAVKQQSSLVSQTPLTNDEVDFVRKEVFANFPIRVNKGLILAEENSKWFSKQMDSMDHLYWGRYKEYLSKTQKFPESAIETMEKEDMPAILDCIGNPKSPNPFSKKGLVIGNIQSGKTSNYLGLICNAADAGYRIIILLTGITENLRRQTQYRVDAGFIGNTIDPKTDCPRLVGVNKDGLDKRPFPHGLTTVKGDFNSKSDNNSLLNSIDNIDQPLIFVIKKNVKVLERLTRYLRGALHYQDEKIQVPLLLVDDEADNASINTKNSDVDPTRTNESIRQLLSIFDKTTYVGYTATPFANVFILPQSTDALQNEELFPKDFIYYLDVPRADAKEGFNSSHYIGPELVFNNDAAQTGIANDTMNMIEEIDDDDPTIFSMKHKKDVEIDCLFGSYYKSVRTFLLSNAIRDLRKDYCSHRSMLVNMSRFIKVQKRIAEITEDYLKDVIRDVKDCVSLSQEECMENKTMQELYYTWKDEYEDRATINGKYDSTDYITWDQIRSVLFKAIKDIKIVVVNSAYKDQLNYEKYQEKGLRVIAIGGLALSRGLTLNGLTVSYFYRNTSTYDVLMQMGRWFGYRPGYADICRLWITDDSITWYQMITKTIAKLHDDIFVMNHTLDPQGNRWTPLRFGIRVWSASNVIGLNKKARLTSSNKMRSAVEKRITNSYFGLVPETRYFYTDPKYNDILIQAIKNLDLKDFPLEKLEKRQVFGIQNVPQEKLLSFLNTIKSSIDPKNSNIGFYPDQLIPFLHQYKDDPSFATFDIGFYGGRDAEVIEIPGLEGTSIRLSDASFDLRENSIRLRGIHTRLGSKTDTNIFPAKSLIGDDLNETYFAGDYDETYYLKYRDKPLLMVYFLRLTDDLFKKEKENGNISIQEKALLEKEEKVYEYYKDHVLIGLAFGVQDDGRESHQESYFINSGADYFENHNGDSSEEFDEIKDQKEE